MKSRFLTKPNLNTDLEHQAALHSRSVYRRQVGALLGLLLGLVYGVISQSMNPLALPELPLYQPPLGAFWNAVIWPAAGLLLGLVSAWPEESLYGTLASSATGTLLLILSTLVSRDFNIGAFATRLMIWFFLFLPTTALLLLILWAHRWATNQVVEERGQPFFSFARVRGPLLLLVLVGWAASLSLYPDYALGMLNRTQALLEQGQAAGDPASLPKPLQHERVGGFLEHGQGGYTLEWNNKITNIYNIPRSMAKSPWEESVVIIRFENGWNLVCLYADGAAEASCRGFDLLP